MDNYTNNYDKLQQQPFSQPPTAQNEVDDIAAPVHGDPVGADDAGTFEKFSRLQDLKEQLKHKLFEPKPGVSPARQKTMVLLVPILFVVFVFMMLRFCLPAGTSASVAPEPETTNTAAAEHEQLQWQKPSLWPDDIRDPMNSAAGQNTDSQQTEINISGIVHSDNPSVIINGRLLRAGQQVADMEIVEISRSSVKLKDQNGQTQTYQVE